MTEDDSEITNLNELFEYMHLPDLWIVSSERHEQFTKDMGD